ncbi:MAG: hybrid sensor histidine kinase/response regulator [Phaeodactylibacter sp.]|uniref:hybrid sensor histidine kinase/response regulator n=1 Tax=Phaeodactylibacter sp. TaxID=1940289 RepID=UPI0032EB3F8C
MPAQFLNTRVLVIDDEEMVRDNIRQILQPQAKTEHAGLSAAASVLFDEAEATVVKKKTSDEFPDFIVDLAVNGKEGYEMIKAALEAGQPYAAIFLDMRMPGWDGLETAIHIRQVDQKAEIIIVTAYSDHSIKDIISKAGHNVGYHVKPYASEEILQLATKAVYEYNRLNNLEALISVIGNIHLSQKQLDHLLQNIVDQLAMYINTDTALLGKFNAQGHYVPLASVGNAIDSINIERVKEQLGGLPRSEGKVVQIGNIITAHMSPYDVFAALPDDSKLRTEKLYLLQLFLSNASQAIHNAELKEALLKKEKLSAAGNAVGMLMHDLRTPIKSITLIADILDAQGADSEATAMLREAGNQASEIFDDFLDYLRETPLQKQPVDLTLVLQQAIKLCEDRTPDHGVMITVDMPEQLEILGDGSKLKRSLSNLIGNAIDVLSNSQTAGPKIKIDIVEAPEYVQITISDNGPGIPNEILPKVFEPFITKNKANGTGLGLAIVKQYIEGHNGRITVRNDQGAIFDIQLPKL